MLYFQIVCIFACVISFDYVACEGTIKEASPFDAKADATAIENAGKVSVTEFQNKCIEILTQRTAAQRQAIAKELQNFNDPSVAFIKNMATMSIEIFLNGVEDVFRDTVYALVMGPDLTAALYVYLAMWMPTDFEHPEYRLLQILIALDGQRAEYIKFFDKWTEVNPTQVSLQAQIETRYSDDLENFLQEFLVKFREEKKGPVDSPAVTADLELLAQERDNWNDDRVALEKVLMISPIEHARAVLIAYRDRFQIELKEDLQGKVEDEVLWGYQALCDLVVDRASWLAKRIHDSVTEIGDMKWTAIVFLVLYSETETMEIREAFQKLYNKSLYDFLLEGNADNPGCKLLAEIVKK